ncbi:hypothetical protein [Halorarum halobium]|uniref:hypothetical protein n=1 Tax=Halorarum halobium TaxID=3075121 RepID=UPI0028AD9C56|nr:hypothetical protein [Halobaculum sp. XH14]
MSDAEALEELAAAIYHVQKAESKAETELVANMLENSLDDLDDQAREILTVIGEQEYQKGRL